jgi:hypothetical protein
MKLNNFAVANPKEIMERFESEGLNTELLEECNHQEFRMIDGYGKGKFLCHSDSWQTTNEKVELVIFYKGSGTPAIFNVFVTNATAIYYPSSLSSVKQLYVIETAELKYEFTKEPCTSNYNVLDRRTYAGGTCRIIGAPTTPLTLAQIIEDITGIAPAWTGNDIFPYDVFVEGMSKIDAVDMLCKAYGLTWTYTGTTLHTFHGSTTTLPGIGSISEVEYPVIQNGLKEYTTQFPVLDCCVQTPVAFRTINSSINNVGRTRDSYLPFFYAKLDSSGLNENTARMTSVHDLLKNNFNGLSKIENYYLVKKYFTLYNPTTPPTALTITYANNGFGNRTIYHSRDYPMLPLPKAEAKDRLCKRWIGLLPATYYGTVASFNIIPLYGLDGTAPIGEQTVINLFKWNYGVAGTIIGVEWDCVNYRWIAWQQEYTCPPKDASPTAPVPPIDDPVYPNIIGVA